MTWVVRAGGIHTLTTMNQQETEQNIPQHEVIKLGIDAHARWYHVVRQVDGATPQPVQKMDLEGLLRFVAKQQRLAKGVWSCYEASGFGYHLHRQLTALGVQNVVVQPQDWDERGKGVKSDGLDAQALCLRLDRYVRGNRKAFATVRVPSEEEEEERALWRQRQQLVRERQRLAAMGRSLLAMRGIHVSGRWWKGRTWARIEEQAPPAVKDQLERFVRLIEAVEAEVNALTEAVEGACEAASLPRGIGPLTFEALRREVGDWARFRNRREVSSYTGLCPREHSSGGRRRQGSVNKSGNPRVRALLVEAVWRLMRWQPGYRAFQKWAHVLGSPAAGPGARKKAVVAIARQLAVDLWRLFTGQTTAEALGLSLVLRTATPNVSTSS